MLCKFSIVFLLHYYYYYYYYVIYFLINSLTSLLDEPQFQSALINLFHQRGSDEISAKEAVKEHLWELHFSEYGRLGFCYFYASVCYEELILLI